MKNLSQSLKTKAAAELELRRRRHGKDCHLCDVWEEIAEIYDGKPERPETCPHPRQMQLDASRVQAEIDLLYGDDQQVSL